MELFKKDENWWLRLTIVIISLTSLSTLVYYSKQVTQGMNAKSQSDSVTYYKNLNDTLYNELETIREETDYTRNINARIEIGVNDYIDDSSHAQMKEDKGFISKYTKAQRIKAIKRIEILRLINDYQLCSWIIALEIYRKEEPGICGEIDQFIDHLTE